MRWFIETGDRSKICYKRNEATSVSDRKRNHRRLGNHDNRKYKRKVTKKNKKIQNKTNTRNWSHGYHEYEKHRDSVHWLICDVDVFLTLGSGQAILNSLKKSSSVMTAFSADFNFESECDDNKRQGCEVGYDQSIMNMSPKPTYVLHWPDLELN